MEHPMVKILITRPVLSDQWNEFNLPAGTELNVRADCVWMGSVLTKDYFIPSFAFKIVDFDGRE